MKKNTTRAIFANHFFLRLWFGQIFSQTSAYLLNFILLVRIYAATHSTTALSVFLMFYMAPSILLGFFSGALIDYWNKRKILVWTNLAQACVVLLYLLAGKQILLLYPIVFLYSLCDEFFTPAQQSMLPEVVDKTQLPKANALLMFTSQGAILAGAILGGPIIRYLPSKAPFLIVSALLFIGARLLSRIPDDEQNNRRQRGQLEPVQFVGQLMKDVAEGYRFIAGKPRVFYPFVFYAAAQVVAGVSVALFPSLAEEIFRIQPQDAGMVIFLPAALGALLGSFWLNIKIKDWGRKRLISIGWLLMGLAFVVMGLVVPGLRLPVLGGFLLMIPAGLGGILVLMTSLVMLQENTPTQLRGRVFATLSALLVVCTYLPLFFLAATTDLLGLATTILMMGFGAFVIGFVSFKIDRKYVLSNSYRA